MKLVTFVNTELRNLFSKPATRPYPMQPREYTQRTRGHIENNINECTFCTLCDKRCPTGAIHVDRAAKTWAIDPFSCIQCGYCVEGCPKKCLSMKTTYTEPGDNKITKSFTPDPKEEPAAPAAPKAAPAAPAAKIAAPEKPVAPAEVPTKVETVKAEAPEEKENN